MKSRRIPGAAVAGAGDAPAPFRPMHRIPSPAIAFDDTAEESIPDDLPAVRPFGQPSVDERLRLDPELHAHVDRIVAQARADGEREGREAGRAEAEQRIDSLSRSVALSVSEIEDRLEHTRQANIGGLIDLAKAIAKQVIGRTPHDAGAALLARLEEVADLLDERPLTIRVSPTDADVIRAAKKGHPDLAVDVDASLQPGEAVVTGGWSHADLTHAAAWEALERHLAE